MHNSAIPRSRRPWRVFLRATDNSQPMNHEAADAPVQGYLEFEGEVRPANQRRVQKVLCRLDVDLRAEVAEARRNGTRP